MPRRRFNILFEVVRDQSAFTRELGEHQRSVIMAAMCPRVHVAAGVAVVLLVLPCISLATPARVRLFRPAHQGALVRELTARTAGEVVAAGFSVDLQEPSDARPTIESTPPDPTSFASTAASAPVASIVISAVGVGLADGQIDIAVGEQLIYRATVRRSELATADGGRVLAAAAVRAVAVLQASLIDRGPRKSPDQAATPSSRAPTQPAAQPRSPPSPSLSLASSPSSAPSPPPPGVLRQPSQTSPASWREEASPTHAGSARVGVGLGASVFQSLEGVGPTLAPTARLSYRATPLVSAGVRLTAVGTSASATAPAGAAHIHQDLALGDVLLAFHPAGRLHPVLMTGAGVYHMSLEGSGTSPFVGRTDRLWGAAAAAGVGLFIDVAPRVSVTVESHTLWVWPQPLVQIDSVRTGRTGRPSLTHSLGLMVWL